MADGIHPYKSRPVAGTHVWLTPPKILNALGEFDLDPCAAPEPRPWPTAVCHFVEADDGLNCRWFGRVWCNPPFGNHTWPWLQRMADHGNGVALAFARTDTVGFKRTVWDRADALLFLTGRPQFHYPDGMRARGNSGGPIVLIAYGDKNVECLASCGLDGGFVRLTP